VLTLPQRGALLTISGPWCGVCTVRWGFPKASVNAFGGICNHLHVYSIWTRAIVSHRMLKRGYS